MSDRLQLALALGGTALAAYAIRRSVESASDAHALAIRRALDERDVEAPEPAKRKAAQSAATPPAPQPPAPQPAVPLGRRVTRSSTDEHLRVVQSPASLLAQARRWFPDLTLDEYTAARLAASEHARGSFTELTAIVDAEANRAGRKRLSVFEHLTRDAGRTFGRQGTTEVGRRAASTRRDPHDRHVRAALAVLRSGEARGVSQGAERFFDPRTQYKLWRAGRSCDPFTILERWSFAYPWRGPTTGRDSRGLRICHLNRQRPGTSPLEWVGPIARVDPLEVMLFRPARLGTEHSRRYRAARQLLEAHLANS